MQINQKKTKTLIFNFTDKYQFSARLQIKYKTVDVLSSTKLLGTIITDDLKWNLNTMNIVKKANARMELVRKMASFGTSVDDLKNIYFLFIMSLLEHSGLTEENSNDLERVQKLAVKIILGEEYVS